MKYLIDILDNTKNRLYPKTRKARDYIIKDNRLDLLSVTRCRGYNWLDRLKIFLSR